MFGPEYPKIQTLFKRDEKTKVIIPDQFTQEEFTYLAKDPWVWTEKIDGTNVRIHWNGTTAVVGGRTDNAQMPAPLMEHLRPFLNGNVWLETFGHPDVTVYGEGYGPGIQKGGHYRTDQAFIAFDIRIGEYWLKREDMIGIAERLGFNVVPLVGEFNLLAAIAQIKDNRIPSAMGPTAVLEGIVGHPAVDVRDSHGKRITVKLKVRDFEELRRKSG